MGDMVSKKIIFWFIIELISFALKEVYRVTDIYFLSIIGNIGIIISSCMLIKNIQNGELKVRQGKNKTEKAENKTDDSGGQEDDFA